MAFKTTYNHFFKGKKAVLRKFRITNPYFESVISDDRRKYTPFAGKRETKWTESIAVSDIDFVMKAQEKSGSKAVGKKIQEYGVYEL